MRMNSTVIIYFNTIQ
uniref:Uncharacterized protein n=1 Tax=Lepeophtheirus salmonis TaxID=72036 RepID=A0A0K2SWQ7_LEPSM